MFRSIIPFALLLTAPALAQTAGPAANPYLHDETKTDAEAKAAQQFAAFDINKDGFVTVDEITAYIVARRPKTATTNAAAVPQPSAMAKAMMDDADADKDGKVSAEEAKAAADRGFDETDTDHDGTISPAERIAATQDVTGTRRARPQENGR